jgi:hypothetical protein
MESLFIKLQLPTWTVFKKCEKIMKENIKKKEAACGREDFEG